MFNKTKLVGYLISLLFSMSIACILEAKPTIIHTPTEEVNLFITRTNTPTSESPEPTQALNPCPPIQNLSAPEKENFAEFPEKIEKYLAQGGSPENIKLDEGEVCISVDFTGNQYRESVCLFIDSTSTSILPSAIIALYQCKNGTIHLSNKYQPDEWGGLEIVGTSDLTLDGIADLIFAEVQCGAHTCWHSLYMWSWSGSDIIESIGGELSFPFPEYYLENNKLMIESSGIGSVGAGPQRLVTTTIAWNGTVVTATLSQKEAPFFRYHAFIDGDALLEAGDFVGARNFYQQVINDVNLQSWGVTYSPEEETSWLKAIAHWRLLNISVIDNDLINAQQYLEQVNDHIPVNKAGYPVLEISENYWQKIQSGTSLDKACDVVYASSEVQQVLDFLNSFGYANPHYQIDELCFLSSP